MTSPEPTPCSCVLLAGQHSGLREGLRALLETRFETVFMVAEEPSLLDGADRLQPLLIVIDLSLAEGDLAGLLERVRLRAPEPKLLLISIHDEARIAALALENGADGVVLTRCLGTDFLPAVDALLAGQGYVSPRIV